MPSPFLALNPHRDPISIHVTINICHILLSNQGFPKEGGRSVAVALKRPKLIHVARTTSRTSISSRLNLKGQFA